MLLGFTQGGGGEVYEGLRVTLLQKLKKQLDLGYYFSEEALFYKIK